MAKKVTNKKESLPMEEMLWKACDALLGSIEPSEYKHVVLSLIFLKYADFHFEKRRQEIIADGLEDFVDSVEFYAAKNVFYLPVTSRWSYLKENAKQPDIASKVDKALAEMIEPYEGKIHDPCCGSGGMFVQSLKFVESHNSNRRKVSVYGQEFTKTTFKLAKMNLAIRGIAADLGDYAANTFTDDRHSEPFEKNLREESKSRAAVLDVFKSLGYEINI